MPTERNTLRRRAEALLDALNHGAPEDPERVAQEAHALALKAGDRLLEAESLLQLARTQVSRRDPAESLMSLRRAEVIFEANRRPDRAASCRVDMARALYDLAEERNAIAMAQAALREAALPADERVAALVQMAVCHGHVGELDEALRLLRDEATPLLRPGTPARVRARFDQALGLMHLQVLICKRWPALWRGLTGIADVLEPVSASRALLAQLDAAAGMPAVPGQRGHAAIAAQVAHGLFGAPADAVAELGSIAEARQRGAPIVAGWALYAQAVVLRHVGQHRPALAAMRHAMALARPLGATLLVRDLLLQESRSHDALGDVADALTTYRQAAQLRVRGLLLSRPVAGSETERGNAPQRLELEPAHVKRAVRFIQDRLLDDIDVGDVVHHCGVGRRTLETAFKSSRGITVAQFVKLSRLDRAADALRHSDRSVQDVARSVGFRSPSAFAREFAARFGTAPAAWRRLNEPLVPPA